MVNSRSVFRVKIIGAPPVAATAARREAAEWKQR